MTSTSSTSSLTLSPYFHPQSTLVNLFPNLTSKNLSSFESPPSLAVQAILL